MKKRLEYIDLAKGFGIIFIIAYHLRILPSYLPHLTGAWVPLFFILSGLFFNERDKFKLFIIKKINTLLIPFLFFYTIPYIIFYLFETFSPGLIKTPAQGILDLFVQEDYFNGPIWFLLSLFWDFIFLWCIFKATTSEIFRFLIVLATTFIGIVLGKYNIFLPLKLAPSFSCLIFIYTGVFFKNSGGLDIKESKLKFLLWGIGLITVAVGLNAYFSPLYLELYNNTIFGNTVINYIIVTSFSFGMVFLCRLVNTLPLISYFGKYSLIPLCLHHVIYRPILLICGKFPSPINDRCFVTIVTILIIWILIPICLRYIPYFCGKKPLIPLNK